MNTGNLESLLDHEDCTISNLANSSAFLYDILDDINWLGFYIVSKNKLILGPFQGKPACVNIPIGKGVCGTAVLKNKVIVVDNVDNFPGHIVCDCKSKSEIVIPIYYNNEIVAILDVDSPILNRFNEKDSLLLIKACSIIENKCKWYDIRSLYDREEN